MWRKPLREAMDWLRDSLSPLYEGEASKYLIDPWHARNDYIAVILDREKGNVEAFLKRHSRRELSPEEKTTALRLLEMQRNAMLMYTSCGWYFYDISGIEAIQVMKYASRAIQLASQVSGIDLEPGYLERLRWAKSSKGGFEDGEEVYLRLIKPEVVDLMKVGVHYAISAIFNSHGGDATKVYSYAVMDELFLPMKAERSTLLIGRSNIASDITWESKIASYAVLWLGGNIIYGGARSDMSPEEFDLARSELQNAFKGEEAHRIMAVINDRFNAHACAPCSLKDLFKDKQVEIVNSILQAPLQKAMDSYTQIFSESHSIMQTLADLGAKPPLELQAAAEVIFTKQVIDLLGKEKVDLARLEAAVREIKNLRMELGKELIALEAQRRIEANVDTLSKDPSSIEGARDLERLIGLLLEMDLPMNLWRAQNKWYYLVGLLKSTDADGLVSTPTTPWSDAILKISEYLRVRV